MNRMYISCKQLSKENITRCQSTTNTPNVLCCLKEGGSEREKPRITGLEEILLALFAIGLWLFSIRCFYLQYERVCRVSYRSKYPKSCPKVSSITELEARSCSPVVKQNRNKFSYFPFSAPDYDGLSLTITLRQSERSFDDCFQSTKTNPKRTRPRLIRQNTANFDIESFETFYNTLNMTDKDSIKRLTNVDISNNSDNNFSEAHSERELKSPRSLKQRHQPVSRAFTVE